MVIIVLSEAKPLHKLAFGTSKERVAKQWVELKVSMDREEYCVQKVLFRILSKLIIL